MAQDDPPVPPREGLVCGLHRGRGRFQTLDRHTQDVKSVARVGRGLGPRGWLHLESSDRAEGSRQQPLEFLALQGQCALPGGTHHGAEGWAKKEQLSPHVCQGPPSLFSAKCAQSPILVGTGQAWRSPSSCHVPSLCFCLAAGLLGPGLSERSAEARRKAAKGEEDTAGGKLWVSQTRKEDPTLRAPTHTALLGSVFSLLWYCRGSASAPTM